MDPSKGTELARQLKVVLDRALWIDLATLSPRPEGHADDSLPAYRDRVGVIDTPEGKIEVLMQRVPRADGVSIWKFSNRTVMKIPTLYRHHGYTPLAEELTKVLPEFRLLGLESWQWVGMIGLAIVSYLLAWALTALVAWPLRRRGTVGSDRVARLVTGPVQLLLTVILFGQGIDLLAPPLVLRALVRTQTLTILFAAWVIVRVADLFLDRLREGLERQRTGSAVFVGPLQTVTRIVVVLVALLVWLENVGFNVTTLMAGLGIGGLAVALAAQKSLEDVFGAITLYGSRPVRVGDFCRFGDRVGTVEEIGLRWTRVRALDHTVVSIPNSNSSSRITTCGGRSGITRGFSFATRPRPTSFATFSSRFASCSTRTPGCCPIRHGSASSGSATGPWTSMSLPISTRGTTASSWRSPRT
jgi:MscS family membrane protein